MSFLPLADALGSGVSVYGIEPFAELNSASNAIPRTVESAAAACVASLRERGVGRQCSLIGHSFGGWVVFETALRLAHEGKQLPQLFLIDSDGPCGTSRQFDTVETLLRLADCLEMESGRTLGITKEGLDALKSNDRVRWFIDHLKRLGFLAANAHSKSILEMIENFERDINVSYQPRERLASKMTIFQPEEVWRSLNYRDDRLHELTADEKMSEWQTHASAVERIWVSGNHMTMLKAPHVQTIAELCARPPYFAM